MESALIKSVGFVHLPRPQRLLAARGRARHRDARQARQGRRQPALAITDTNNLFGALEFSEKLAKSGLQPIIGAQITVDFGDTPKGARVARFGNSSSGARRSC